MCIVKSVSSWARLLRRSITQALGLKATDPSPRELLHELRKFRGRLPAGFGFDRLEANERR
jgi:hypothetical protein